MMGQVSIWTGINGSGKSTLLGQLLINSINQGFPVCAFSGELPQTLFKYWIELQMAGPNHIKSTYDSMKMGDYYVSSEIRNQMSKWYEDNFFLYDSFESTKDEDILRILEYSAMRYNTKVFLIDNLMVAQYLGDEYYKAQSNFVGKLVEFSHKFDAHVHIVAHPRKTYGGIITKENIKGSGDITNRADVAFILNVAGKRKKSLCKFKWKASHLNKLGTYNNCFLSLL